MTAQDPQPGERPQRIAILGTGGIARGSAAVLAQAGHAPVLWSPTGRDEGLRDGTMTVTGIISGTVKVERAETCAQAVEGADAVIVAIVGNGHRAVMEALAPHLRPGQLVIINAHLSLSALYLSKLLAERGVEVPIAAWATTAVTARRSGANSVHVSGLRRKLDVATVPVRQGALGLAGSQALFGDRFEPRDDLLAITLSNLNPPAHMANLLLNLTRAERGEDWPNYGSITPAVGRLIEALDLERVALAASFGLKVRTVHEHFVLSHGCAPGSVAAMAHAVYQHRPELMGPKSLDTRFVTEDVPFGLAPLELIGCLAGVPMPLHMAGIALFSAIYERNFRAENDILPALALDGIEPAELHRLTREGWWAR